MEMWEWIVVVVEFVAVLALAAAFTGSASDARI